jgi:uncharacterized membrane protein
MGNTVHEHDSNARSMMKSITWRIVATLTTIIVVLILARDIWTALTVGALDTIVKFILYFFHERAWDRLDWGKMIVGVK